MDFPRTIILIELYKIQILRAIQYNSNYRTGSLAVTMTIKREKKWKASMSSYISYEWLCSGFLHHTTIKQAWGLYFVFYLTFHPSNNINFFSLGFSVFFSWHTVLRYKIYNAKPYSTSNQQSINKDNFVYALELLKAQIPKKSKIGEARIWIKTMVVIIDCKANVNNMQNGFKVITKEQTW